MTSYVLHERYTQTVKLHILSCVFVYTVLVLFSSQCDSFKSDKFRCRIKGACVCTFENNDGYDLSELNGNKYRLEICSTYTIFSSTYALAVIRSKWLNATKDNITFYFQPCADKSIGNESDLNDCYEGVSVCLYNHSNQSYANLGFSHEVDVISKGPSYPVTFVYIHHNVNSSVSSITKIHLKCQSGASSLDVISGGSDNEYELVLQSPSACLQRVFLKADPPVEPGHLSTGSVLVIMLIVFSSLYFVGGALVLKLLRGAEGREMIPNYDFWVCLPGLVKEGFMFTLSGCRTPQAYDRI